MCKSARAAGKILDEVAGRRGGRLRRVRRRCRPTWPPGGARLPIVIHEVNVPPGVANRLGMRFTKNVAVGFPHQPQQAESLRDARVVGVPLRTAIATLDRAALRPQARAHFGLRPGPAGAVRLRRLVRAPARSTWRWPGRPRSSPAPASRCCTCMGARNDPCRGAHRPAGAVRGAAVPVRDGAGLRRRRPDAVPRRRDDRAPRRPRSGCRPIYVPYPHSNRSRGATRCRWSRPAAACWSTTRELTPEWIERTVIPLARDPQRLAAMGAAAARVRPPRRRRGAAATSCCEAVAR